LLHYDSQLIDSATCNGGWGICFPTRSTNSHQITSVFSENTLIDTITKNTLHTI
jgi:hypothetical protein